MPPSLNLPRTLCLYTVCRLLRARFNFNSRSPSGSKLALCPAIALRFLPNFCPLATYQGVRQPPTPLGLFVLDVRTYQGLNPGYSWETNFSSIHLVITRVLWLCPYNRTIAFGWISIALTIRRMVYPDDDIICEFFVARNEVCDSFLFSFFYIREMENFVPLFFFSSSKRTPCVYAKKGHSRSRSTPRRAYTYSWCH